MYKTMRPLRATAYDRFVELLLQGRVLPGDIISQRDLVVETGMPLGSVREMIPRLEAEGLIQTVPKRGLQIPRMHEKLIEDVFIMRRLIEREAFLFLCRVAEPTWLAGSVAAHRVLKAEIIAASEEARTQCEAGPHTANPAEDFGIDASSGVTLLKFPNVVGAGSMTPPAIPNGALSTRHNARLAELGRDLHQTAIDALENETLATVYRANAVKVGMIRAQKPASEIRHAIETIDEHLAVLYALQSRNSGRTAGAVQAHLESAKRRALILAPDPEGDPASAAIALGAA